ncbi:MAG: glycoside hydrolase domain-containing protein [Candidatus Omnitrophota bacterium]
MRKWIPIAGVLVVGILIGSFLSRVSCRREGAATPEKEIFASGELILGDFETEGEVKRWQAKQVSAFLSDEHVVRGKHSVKLAYMAEEAPRFVLEDFFRKNRRARDWRGYEALTFNFYNPSSSQERVILQIKDSQERRYKETLSLPANNSMTYTIPLEDLSAFIDFKEIVQVNFFRWRPKKPVVFYLDDVRLTPKEKTAKQEEAAAAEKAGEPKEWTASKKEKTFDASIRTDSPNAASGVLFQKVASNWVAASEATGERFIRIPITVAKAQTFLPDRFPVSGGIPFPYGYLKDASSVHLRTADRDELPIQTRGLAFWEDGSIRWLLVTTELLNHASDKKLYLEIYPTAKTRPELGKPVQLSEDSSSVAVITGPLKFSVGKKSFHLFESAYLDANGDGLFGEEEKIAAGGDLVLRHRGAEYRSSLDEKDYTLVVEESGPLRATLKATGWFRNQKGEPFCQYQVRLQAFAGRSDLRMYHTFIYTGYPENLYHHEYEGKKLPANETIEEVSIEENWLPGGDLTYQVGLPAKVLMGEAKNTVLLSQPRHDKFQLSLNKEVVHAGDKATGWVDVSSPSRGLTVNVRDFWQQYPKEILMEPSGKVKVSLWPVSAGALSLETQSDAYGPDAVARGSAFGLAKTHEVVFSFHAQQVRPEILHPLFSAFQQPPILVADPQWLYATYALGSLGPARPGQDGEELLALLFGWAERQPKAFAWYGMLDYGDTRVWHRKEAYDKSYPDWGWHPEGRWGWFNVEQVGSHAAALLQFARTGNYRCFAFGDASARHIMDVDTIHYDTIANDRRLKGYIIGDHSKVGSIHRHNANHWGGRSDEASHTHVLGFLLYYYLTGDERALDVAKESGSFLLTGPITYTRHPDIAPQRAVANTLWGCTLLYEATGDKRYKEAADKWAELFVKGQEESGVWQANYNPRSGQWFDGPERRWVAFHTLPALITYHRLTGNPQVKEAIIRGTDFLIHNEQYVPFFDALAYSYELTAAPKYLEEARRRLDQQMKAQNRSEDPLRRGMVFEKLNYERVPPLLYTVPYFIGTRNPALLASVRPPEAPSAPSAVGNYDVRQASPFQRVLRGATPSEFQTAGTVHLSLAANESESAQLILFSGEEDLENFTVRPKDLVHDKTGARIPQENVSVYVVGYVSMKQSDSMPDLVGLVPDPLLEKEAFTVKRGVPQPVWVTVHAPSGTEPGLYRGSVVLKGQNGPEKEVTLELRVWDFELPKTPRLKTAFDLYQGRLFKGYQDYFPDWWQSWKDKSGELENLFYERMLSYRISPILNIDPSNVKDVEQVRRLLERGMTSFGVGKYSGSGGNNWPNDTASYIPLYRNYGALLRDFGLLPYSYLYTYDEPEPGDEKVAQICKAVHEADPELRNLVAFHTSPVYQTHADWLKDIDIVCVRNVVFDPSQAEAYRRAGKELWIYVSGPSWPYPTFVIDYPTMAYRILPWMCWKYKVTGLLYWCVNFWTKNPYTDTANTKWGQNGNGALFYPGPDGPVGSIRLEILRDGIEDYDMLALLAERIAEAKGKGMIASGTLQKAEQVLSEAENLAASMRQYPKEPGPLLELREKIAESIEALSSTRTRE